jgi:hypothetical protein
MRKDSLIYILKKYSSCNCIKDSRGKTLTINLVYLAGERGFEPLLYGPEPHVLPLDDSPLKNQIRLLNNTIKTELI